MKYIVLIMLAVSVLIMTPNDGLCDGTLLNLGPEELVQAGGVNIDVGTYSVPSFVDWDNDNLKDLVIGTGSGYVRVYLNDGAESAPSFSDYFYAQSNGANLYCLPSGCMGCFPRVIYWDADVRKDLLVGQADGTVKIFLNIGTDKSPTFDGGTLLQVGQPGFESDINVGLRATPTLLEWNNDNKTDLIVGGLDGKIHIYLNCGCGGAVPPVFFTSTPSGIFAQEDGADLVVPSQRSSPVILDLDGDGKKDLLVGNTNGQLLFYSNVGTDSAPTFSGYSFVESNGVPIDLPSYPRSRPSVCYWTASADSSVVDGYPDVLIGAYDGQVHLYQGIPEIGDLNGDGRVNFADFASFAIYWRQTNCGECGGADLANDDGNVNLDDLRQFAANWLIGVE
ncbi:MAG: FG-GAP-like repeat-containing protein [Planctomycetota bacterium]|jgi:hypothetical protein